MPFSEQQRLVAAQLRTELRDCLRNRGISLRDAADGIGGITYSALGHFLSGKTEVPYPRTRRAMVRWLDEQRGSPIPPSKCAAGCRTCEAPTAHELQLDRRVAILQADVERIWARLGRTARTPGDVDVIISQQTAACALDALHAARGLLNLISQDTPRQDEELLMDLAAIVQQRPRRPHVAVSKLIDLLTRITGPDLDAATRELEPLFFTRKD